MKSEDERDGCEMASSCLETQPEWIDIFRVRLGYDEIRFG